MVSDGQGGCPPPGPPASATGAGPGCRNRPPLTLRHAFDDSRPQKELSRRPNQTLKRHPTLRNPIRAPRIAQNQRSALSRLIIAKKPNRASYAILSDLRVFPANQSTSPVKNRLQAAQRALWRAFGLFTPIYGLNPQSCVRRNSGASGEIPAKTANPAVKLYTKAYWWYNRHGKRTVNPKRTD